MAPGNRSSMIGVQPLPVITENPDALHPPSTLCQAHITPIIPANQRRRSQPSRSLSPSQTPNSSHHTTAQERPPTHQPPHFPAGIIPPIHMPPAAYRPPSSNYAPPPPSRHYRHHSNSSGSAEKEDLYPPVLIPLPNDEKDWFARRGGWWRVALYGTLFVSIAVGLGLGLTIGLKRKSEDEIELL